MLTLKTLLLDLKNQLQSPWTGLILAVLPEEWLVNKITTIIPLSSEQKVDLLNRLQALASAEGKTLPQLLTSKSFINYIDGFISILDVDVTELRHELVEAASQISLKALK